MTQTQLPGELFGTSLPGDVEIVEYDPRWPLQFAELRDELLRALAGAAVRVDHVGSTAVPGLPAKPVIDVQVAVADVTDEPSYRPALERLGLALRYREPGWLFFRPAVPPRTHHVHVTQVGSAREREQLDFVTYLRAHRDRRDAYAALKRALAERYRTDRVAYTDAKTPFVRETLELAAASRAAAHRPTTAEALVP